MNNAQLEAIRTRFNEARKSLPAYEAHEISDKEIEQYKENLRKAASGAV